MLCVACRLLVQFGPLQSPTNENIRPLLLARPYFENDEGMGIFGAGVPRGQDGVVATVGELEAVRLKLQAL